MCVCNFAFLYMYIHIGAICSRKFWWEIKAAKFNSSKLLCMLYMGTCGPVIAKYYIKDTYGFCL